jgi:hypothetical protein
MAAKFRILTPSLYVTKGLGSAEFQGEPARMRLGFVITEAPALTVNLGDSRLEYAQQLAARAS